MRNFDFNVLIRAVISIAILAFSAFLYTQPSAQNLAFSLTGLVVGYWFPSPPQQSVIEGIAVQKPTLVENIH